MEDPTDYNFRTRAVACRTCGRRRRNPSYPSNAHKCDPSRRRLPFLLAAASAARYGPARRDSVSISHITCTSSYSHVITSRLSRISPCGESRRERRVSTVTPPPSDRSLPMEGGVGLTGLADPEAGDFSRVDVRSDRRVDYYDDSNRTVDVGRTHLSGSGSDLLFHARLVYLQRLLLLPLHQEFWAPTGAPSDALVRERVGPESSRDPVGRALQGTARYAAGPARDP
ncbi:hypothetical protein BHM03_00042326 [Ensete ventricosum]|nr:hypothetical protein BHM03_00042326 [Ensete ventricosum]